MIWSIARHRGVPDLFAVKLSIFTVWKWSCTVCSSLPSLSVSLYLETGCRGSLGSRGQQQIQLVSTRRCNLEEPSWLRVGWRSRVHGWNTRKGQVSWMLLFQWATTWRHKGQTEPSATPEVMWEYKKCHRHQYSSRQSRYCHSSSYTECWSLCVTKSLQSRCSSVEDSLEE